MSERVNFFEGGGGAGAAWFGGAGLGIGALLGLALGNRGLFGAEGRVGEHCVTPMQLQTATGSIIDSGQNNQVMGVLNGISTSVPLTASQTQLAVCNTASEIRQHLGQVENTITAGQMAINKNVSDAIAASLASQNNINLNVSAQGAATREAVNLQGQANLIATKDAQAATAAAICASTNAILTALKDNEITNLSRQLTVSELRNTEDRAEARSRAVEVNVAQTVSQNQNQLNLQQQQQSQFQILAQLAAGVNNLCNDIQAVRQTQSNVNFGVQAGTSQSNASTNNRVN